MRAVLSGAYQSLALHREDRRHADRQSNGAVDLLYGQAEADPRDGLEATRLNTSLITRQHAFHLCISARLREKDLAEQWRTHTILCV